MGVSVAFHTFLFSVEGTMQGYLDSLLFFQ